MTLGDEAILEALLKELRASVDAEVVVFSRNPQDTESRHKVRAVPIRDLHKEDVLEQLKQLHLFVLGGGGILFNGVLDGFLRDVNWAKELGIPVMVYAVSVGPITGPDAKQLVVATLNKVDKLTVLAHENFEEVIEAAKDPNSILNKLSFIELDADELSQHSTVVTSESGIQVELKQEEAAIEAIQDEGKKQEAKNTVNAKRLIIAVINDPEVIRMTNGLKDFDKPEVREKVIEKATERLDSGQQNIFKADIIAELSKVYGSTLLQIKKNIIEIPRMDLVQGDVRVSYEDFDLDVSNGLTFRPLSEDIHVQELTGEQKIDTIGVQQGALIDDTPVNQVMNELVNYPEIDYERTADLLFKLSGQAVAKVEEGLVGDNKLKLPLVIRQYRKVIAGKIYEQIKKGHIKIKEAEYVEPKVLPFVKIEEWNFTVPKENGYKDYRDAITPVSTVPKYVYRGFEKSCHHEYKFDSNTEKKFAMMLEADKTVEKWLRPAPNQFRIYWANNSRRYDPDFVVETGDGIYLIETKASDQVLAADVEGKKQAALRYCKSASVFTSANEGKPWKYLLIPHDEVSQTSSFEYFISRFTQA